MKMQVSKYPNAIKVELENGKWVKIFEYEGTVPGTVPDAEQDTIQDTEKIKVENLLLEFVRPLKEDETTESSTCIQKIDYKEKNRYTVIKVSVESAVALHYALSDMLESLGEIQINS